MANMNTLTASLVEIQNQNRKLRESLTDVLALARIKWGNLDADANKVFEAAECALAPVDLTSQHRAAVTSLAQLHWRDEQPRR